MKLLYLPLAAFLTASFLHGGALSNRRAPGFSLPDTDLKQHDLQDHRGKVVVIDLMRTACPHCRTFSHVLERVKQKYGDRVAVLSVVTPPDNPQTVKSYMLENKLTGPYLFDCGQMGISYMRVTPANPTIDLPHAFLIDASGMIRNDWQYQPGSPIFDGEGLFAEIDRLLAPRGKTPVK